ncbi:MAG: hypothetical protein DI537_14710 [Stutzerimonas stutzeri]|nr:MAG: hypothetical protein DI537_14710 [Stutzerimonas stutzeri]
MSRKPQSSRSHQEDYRERRARRGETQVQLWLEMGLREKMDELVRKGGFKNRSDVVSFAVGRLVDK